MKKVVLNTIKLSKNRKIISYQTKQKPPKKLVFRRFFLLGGWPSKISTSAKKGLEKKLGNLCFIFVFNYL